MPIFVYLFPKRWKHPNIDPFVFSTSFGRQYLNHPDDNITTRLTDTSIAVISPKPNRLTRPSTASSPNQEESQTKYEIDEWSTSSSHVDNIPYARLRAKAHDKVEYLPRCSVKSNFNHSMFCPCKSNSTSISTSETSNISTQYYTHPSVVCHTKQGCTDRN